MRSNMVRAVVALGALATVVVPMVGRTEARAATALDVELSPVEASEPGTRQLQHRPGTLVRVTEPGRA